MKENDFNEVYAAASAIVDENLPVLADYIDANDVKWVIALIYWNYNTIPVSTFDFQRITSVIVSNSRISVITLDGASFYKFDGLLCEYENLNDDLLNIIMILDAVCDRIKSRY